MGIKAELTNNVKKFPLHGTGGAIFQQDEPLPPFKVQKPVIPSKPSEVLPQNPAPSTTKWPVHGTGGAIFRE
ncbi:hypothetical protein HZA75_05910 [Candidatus Roizmanbacteria bacterium]|nr:hypothetical protein [Candidatus Roizmanbacteria bacterium]